MPEGERRAGRSSARRLSAREIRAALRGRALRSRRVIVYVSPVPGELRATAVAGRKVGGAVARNRARRILREAWRRLAPRVREGHHIVMVALPAIAGASADDVTVEIGELLAGAGMIA